MKFGISVATITGIGLSISTAALAADLGGGSFKDGIEYSASHSGLYITGSLGIANGNRDISRDITKEVGRFKSDKCGADRKCKDDSKTDVDETADNTEEDVRYETPFITDLFTFKDGDDFRTVAGGAEISYMFQPVGTRFALELGVGVNFYGNNETTHNFTNGVPQIVGGENICCGLDVGDNAFNKANGTLSVERDYDIDLVMRGHYFVTDRLAFNAGIGASIAAAKIKGSHTTDAPNADAYATAFDDTDHSIGYVLTAGALYWVTDNITFGVQYDYKRHDFNVDTDRTTDTDPIYRRVTDHVGVEDEVHTVKARLGIKLN
jgi:opacity protein-like surface antigen